MDRRAFFSLTFLLSFVAWGNCSVSPSAYSVHVTQPFVYRYFTSTQYNDRLVMKSYRLSDGGQEAEGYTSTPSFADVTPLASSVFSKGYDIRPEYFVSLHGCYNGTHNVTRITKWNGNPLNIDPIEIIDLFPLVRPIAFLSAYSAVMTTNSIINPFTGELLDYADPFTFSENLGYTFTAQKGNFPIYLNYDYPNVRILDGSNLPWTNIVRTISTPWVSPPIALYWYRPEYFVVATASSILIFHAFDVTIEVDLPLQLGVSHDIILQNPYNGEIFGWNSLTRTLHRYTMINYLSGTLGLLFSESAIFPIFQSTVSKPILTYNSLDIETSVYKAMLVVDLTTNGIALLPPDCPLGYYSGFGSCKKCPDGTILQGWGIIGSSACVGCPDGYQANQNTNECDPCGAGESSTISSFFFSPSSPCFSCPVGFHSNVTTNHLCAPCERGEYSDEEKLGTCKQCIPGTYTSTKGRTTCDPCEVGYYSEFHGSPGCLACPAGKTSSQPGASSCTDCGVGFYSGGLNYGCVPCTPNTFSNQNASGFCSSCMGNEYAPEQSSQCFPCPPGTKGSGYSGGGCVACPIGTYSNAVSATDCFPCATGEFCPIRSTVALRKEVSEPSLVTQGGYQEDQSGETSFEASYITTLLISGVTAAAILFVLLIIVLLTTCCSCGKAIQFFIKKLDFLYSLDHHTPNGESPVNRKAFTGGFFTIAAVAAIIVLFVSSIVQFATSNVTIRTTISPGIPTSKVLKYINVDLTVNGAQDCSIISWQLAGLKNLDPTVTPLQNQPGCHISWHCENCDLNFGKEVSLLFSWDNSTFVASWNISVSIPYFKTDVFFLQSNILPPGQIGSVFHSGLTEFISLLTPAIYEDIRGSSQEAFLLQYGSVIPGDAYTGNTATSITQLLQFKLTFQQSSITYKEQEVEKMSALNLLSQLLALISGSIAFFQICTSTVDALMKKFNINDPTGDSSNNNKEEMVSLH